VLPTWSPPSSSNTQTCRTLARRSQRLTALYRISSASTSIVDVHVIAHTGIRDSIRFQHQRQCQRRCNARKHIVASDDIERSAESVQRPLQDSVSPTSRSATHICFAASRAATHSNRTTRIGA
jgi:hypothetical protein